jgi:serine acetyltransferase
MGDVVIGNDATILAHSVLLPGSRVGEGEVWGGVPAQLIPRDQMERVKMEIRGRRAREDAAMDVAPPGFQAETVKE